MDTKSQEDKNFEGSIIRREMIGEVFLELINIAKDNNVMQYFVWLLMTECRESRKTLTELIHEVIIKFHAELGITLGDMVQKVTTHEDNVNVKEYIKIRDCFLDSLSKRNVS